ncbi:hypothetical protein [Pedobacter alpinus]|uniref:Uncharacterized protein n=1 Tax=Pedobacter alpinus TaxID=1590643 RepID=A0ABW5TMU8_9SPHI
MKKIMCTSFLIVCALVLRAEYVNASRLCEEVKVNVEKIAQDDDYNFKNFMVNFTPIKHFYFNLTNAQNLSGRDITNLPYTKSNYYPTGGKVKSILALGKIAQCDNSVVVFGVI